MSDKILYTAIRDFDLEIEGIEKTIAIKIDDIITIYNSRSDEWAAWIFDIEIKNIVRYSISKPHFEEIKPNFRELTADELIIKDIIE